MRYLWIYLVPLILGSLAVRAADRVRATAESVRIVCWAGLRLETYRLEHDRLPENADDASVPKEDATWRPLSITTDPQHNSYSVSTEDQSIVLRDGKFVRMPELPMSATVVFAEEQAQMLALVNATPDERKGWRVRGLLDEMEGRLRKSDFEGAYAKYENILAVDRKYSDPAPLLRIATYFTTLDSLGQRPVDRKPELRELAKTLLPPVRAAVEGQSPEFWTTNTLAGLLATTGDAAGARAVIERYAAHAPGDANVHLLRIRWAPRPGDTEAATRAIRQLTLAAGDDPEKLHLAGGIGAELLREPGRLTPEGRRAIARESRKALTHAIEIKPESIEATATLSTVLRAEAEEERDPAKKEALVARADQLRQRAVEIIHAKRKKAAS